MPTPDAAYPCSHYSFQEVDRIVRKTAMTAFKHIPQPNALGTEDASLPSARRVMWIPPAPPLPRGSPAP
ncbi:hypothetical protein CPLU01_15609 [Colletotrichum plurivorum]|uniref:Uncharacterized protein n=1 Tax=Colletotrichum plurivorum TaxID=2175906 RepID=A0A8H6MTT9_9PEZI|nr:hypothetical protein CPLU01_15609 [Colletotrichum plurivorum]